jgi:hypothetical protein
VSELDQHELQQQQSEPDDKVRSAVRDAIGEYFRAKEAKSEPAYKAELVVERQKREQLERRLGELEQENRRARELAEEAERSASIRGELQRLGISKVDLAFRAVKDDIFRGTDGRLVARMEEGETNLREYLQRFVTDNPEFLPARIAGGSGVSSGQQRGTTQTASSGAYELEKIRPGMSAEELERVRNEIARIASQALKGM